MNDAGVSILIVIAITLVVLLLFGRKPELSLHDALKWGEDEIKEDAKVIEDLAIQEIKEDVAPIRKAAKRLHINAGSVSYLHRMLNKGLDYVEHKETQKRIKINGKES